MLSRKRNVKTLQQTYQLIEFRKQSSQWAPVPHSTRNSSFLWNTGFDDGHSPVAPGFSLLLLLPLANSYNGRKRRG